MKKSAVITSIDYSVPLSENQFIYSLIFLIATKLRLFI